MENKEENKFQLIKLNCYGKIIEIPCKYKERIGIIKMFENNDKDIFIEVPENEMLTILCILRDNFQALDKYELEKMKIKYNWNDLFMKHFDYLGIDTDAINKQIETDKELLKEIETMLNYKQEVSKGTNRLSYHKLSLSFYDKYKTTIDKLIKNGFYGKIYKFFKVINFCSKHANIVFYSNDLSINDDIKYYVKKGCTSCKHL
jgi:hypothetical protein